MLVVSVKNSDPQIGVRWRPRVRVLSSVHAHFEKFRPLNLQCLLSTENSYSDLKVANPSLQETEESEESEKNDNKKDKKNDKKKTKDKVKTKEKPAKETKGKKKKEVKDEECEEEMEGEGEDEDGGSDKESDAFDNGEAGDEYMLVLHSVKNKRASHMMGDPSVSISIKTIASPRFELFLALRLQSSYM